MVSENVVLVLQGGGTRAIFSAGVTDALIDGGLTFSRYAGTSAGALICVNLVANQRGRSKDIVIKGMADKRFASFGNYIRTGSYFGFDYLFNVVPKEKIPFDFDSYNASKSALYVGATGVNDGQAHYFDRNTCKDFVAACSASSSLPFLGKPIEVEGDLYMDGGTSCAIPYKKALEDGAEKLVVIMTRARDYRKKPHNKVSSLLYKAKYHKYPKYLYAMLHEYGVYNDDLEELFAMEKQKKAFLIMPRTAPKVGRKEKNVEKLEELYQEGYERGQELLDSLKEFLGEDIHE
ncbi:MAG: patatin family protein [Bacilli bacterium]|nr:patatin family protein [Bacilli bacterium]